MQNKSYLFVIELGTNHVKPINGKFSVEFLAGRIPYTGANDARGYREVRKIGDGVARIRYTHGGINQRNFGLYGLTDGVEMVTETSASGDSVLMEENDVNPNMPLPKAHVIVVPDGRVFVEESLLMRGSSNKEALKKVKQYVPGLFQRMSVELLAI
ncbi:MAG: hypothetical protein HY515_04350 [Candidatus Aenigmarchaeota archaeon]|nr:hypothetical protein [Candidatus Aenigmarchaeota archaeon]